MNCKKKQKNKKNPDVANVKQIKTPIFPINISFRVFFNNLSEGLIKNFWQLFHNSVFKQLTI